MGEFKEQRKAAVSLGGTESIHPPGTAWAPEASSTMLWGHSDPFSHSWPSCMTMAAEVTYLQLPREWIWWMSRVPWGIASGFIKKNTCASPFASGREPCTMESALRGGYFFQIRPWQTCLAPPTLSHFPSSPAGFPWRPFCKPLSCFQSCWDPSGCTGWCREGG